MIEVIQRREIGRVLLAIVGATGLFASAAVAQFNQDEFIIGDLNAALWRLDRSRQLTTIPIRVLPAPIPFHVTPAPNQQDVMVALVGFAGSNGYGAITPGGSLIVYRARPTDPRFVLETTSESRVILTPLGGGPIEEVVLRGATTTVATVPNALQGAAIDTISGDLIAIDGGTRSVLRVSLRSGAVTTVVSGLPSVPSGSSDPPSGIHFDPTSRTMLACYGAGIYRLQLVGGSITTLSQGAPFNSLGAPDYDPATGVFFIPNAANPPAIFGFDPKNSVITTIKALPASTRPGSVAVAGSRELIATSPPMPGATTTLGLVVPSDPGAFYVMALSFGHGPGIPLPGGRPVYLVPDALFTLSLANNGLFNAFQGTLDNAGTAQGTVALPNIPALSGLRFFAAAVTFVNARVSTVTETIGLTVR